MTSLNHPLIHVSMWNLANSPLVKLPPELKLLILSHAAAKNDLAHVSRSCRDLYSLGLPILYKSITLDPGRSAAYTRKYGDIVYREDGLNKVFGIDNPGSMHIRELSITGTKLWRRSSISEFLTSLFNAVPKDQLTKIQLPRTHLIHYSIIEFILERQQKVQYFEIGSLGGEYPHDGDIGPLQLPSIKHLFYNPQWMAPEMSQYIGSLMRRCSNLDQLAIHGRMSPIDRQEETPILSVMLQHPQHSTILPLSLHELSIDGINLDSPVELRTLEYVLNFEVLRTLRLKCIGPFRALSLLSSMVDRGVKFRLKELAVMEIGSSFAPTEPGLLETVLKSFEGLKSLHLSLPRCSRLLDLSSVAHHGSTLEALTLALRTQTRQAGTPSQSGSTQEILKVYTQGQLEKFFETLPFLQNLTVPFPASVHGSEWSIEHIDWSNTTDVGGQMPSLADIHKVSEENGLSLIEHCSELISGLVYVDHSELVQVEHLRSASCPIDRTNATHQSFGADAVHDKPISPAIPGFPESNNSNSTLSGQNPDYWRCSPPGFRTLRRPGPEYQFYLRHTHMSRLRLLHMLRGAYDSQKFGDRFVDLCDVFAGFVFRTMGETARLRGGEAGKSKLKELVITGVYADSGEVSNDLTYRAK